MLAKSGDCYKDQVLKYTEERFKVKGKLLQIAIDLTILTFKTVF